LMHGKSFINKQQLHQKQGEQSLNTERAIHAAVFILLLVGLCTLAGWVSNKYIDDLVLKIAGLALSWGIILLALYLGFKKRNWRWWANSLT
jgi:hypothetical protein